MADCLFNMLIRKFVNKNDVFEAIRWDGTEELANSFIGEDYGIDWRYVSKEKRSIRVAQHPRGVGCSVGSYLCKYKNGKFFSVSETYFNKMMAQVNNKIDEL